MTSSPGVARATLADTGLAVRVGHAQSVSAAQLARRWRPARSRMTVAVRDQDRAAKAGVRGLLFSLARVDANAGPVQGEVSSGPVQVEVSYAGFAGAYGADWASRLRLVSLPACAETTPQLASCQVATPLASRNDPTRATVTGEASVQAGAPALLAVTAAPNGDNGDFQATTLSPASTWQVSNGTGAFSWSYPLRMVPGPGGPAPQMAFAYSSGAVDGRTATSNNQGGWIGDGWESWPGFIERSYQSCVDDNPSHKTGDMCWFNDNATLSLNGHSGELIRSGSVWRLKDDDGTKVERVTDSARGNGDNDNEYWKVTTTDGTQYYFGYHKLPGWVSPNPVTNSVWTVPVFGNNTGEPCYNATFANAYCNQAWRWNLDYVVDPHGTTMAYFYGKETGAYGRDLTASQRTTYDRGGYLDRIEYGMRQNSEYAQAAPVRVVFSTAERCLSGCWSGAAWTSNPVTSAWPDTPWDQYCKAAPCTDQLSPTFWSSRRLTKVTTQIRNGTSSYSDVESWALRQEFTNAGTGEGTPMWLRGITRTGSVTSAGGVAVSDPEVTFDPGAEPLPNRVDGPNDGRTALNRWRIKTITTESGGQILVTYSPVSDCSKSNPPKPATNTTRCMPAFYALNGTPTLDWFHKYVVTRVDLDDTATDQLNQTTFYDYLDAPAWHYNTDEITKDKYRTWGDWRGYGRVQVRQGDPSGTQTATEYRYLRGMDGDRASDTGGAKDVWVDDTWGGRIEDHEALQGVVRQEINFNGPGGAEVSSTVTDPWKSGPTATRSRNGITTTAWLVDTAVERTRTALASGGFRTTKQVNVFNSDGMPTAVDDLGDENVTGDETCTRTTYARNDASWMIDNVSQTEITAGTCATPVSPATVLSRSRTFYDTYVDDSSFGAAPTKGDVVRTEELASWNGSTPVYVASGSRTYDSYGRVKTETDAGGYTTKTEFTTANGGLVTQTDVTNPLGHTETTVKEPAWDLPVKITDENGGVSELTYDGMGRLTAAWLPGRSRASQTANVKFGYLMRNAANQPTAVTTENLLPTGAAYKKSVVLYDGFLRERQTQTQATGGGRLVSDTFYTAGGAPDWTSSAYYDETNTAPGTTLATPVGQIPAITAYTYDGAGRETAKIFKAAGQEKWRSTTSYGGDRVHVVPPTGETPTTMIMDVKGQPTKLLQYKSAADVGSTDPSRYDQTTYTYSLLGQLKTVTDQAGVRWTNDYDLRGRQIQATDPDRGTITATYDDLDRPLTSTAPLASGTATLGFTYDALGRRTSVRDDSPNGALRAAWTYDTAVLGKGRLASSTRYSGTNAYVSRVDAYDVGGKPLTTSVSLPAAESGLCAAAAPTTCVYTSTATYKADGQIATMTLPAAADLASEKLVYGYTDVGEEGTLLSAAQVYLYSVGYDKLGQLTQRQFGAFGSRVVVTSSFDEPTRRATGVNVVPELKAEAANYQYEYDKAGNVTKITDAPAGQSADSQCFGYDYLSRLVEAWTPGSGNCTVSPTVSALGGPAPYWRSWTFDSTGNRRTETRHATTDTLLTSTYPAATASRPHAVTAVTATGAQSWTKRYTYDNGGNTSTRPNATGGTQTLTYNREGALETVVEGTTTTRYLYDADGNRLMRIDGTGRTLYLPGGTEVRYDTATGSKKATRYYSHKGDTIAARNGSSLYWLTQDHHGTAELAISSTALTVAKRRTCRTARRAARSRAPGRPLSTRDS